VGDAIVIRASRDMKQGEEVTLAYILPSVSYDERRFQLMRSWKFNCTCILCEADKRDNPKTREKRRVILQTLNQIAESARTFFDKGRLKHLTAEAKRHCVDMKKSYENTYSASTGGIEYELASALRFYAVVAEQQGYAASDPSLCKLAIELRMDSLDFSGTKVLDRNTSGAPGRNTSLPVDCVRLSVDHDMCILTMLQIVQTFDKLGQKERAQRWLDAALSVEKCYSDGGKESFKILHDEYLNPMGLLGRI